MSRYVPFAMYRLFCPVYVPFVMLCSVSHVPFVMSRLLCPVCHVPLVMPRLLCPVCYVPFGLSRLLCPFFLSCLLLYTPINSMLLLLPSDNVYIVHVPVRHELNILYITPQ